MSRKLYRISALVLGFAFVFAVMGSAVSARDNSNNNIQNEIVVEDKTCKDLEGYDTNIEEDTSGVWGSIDFTKDDGPLVLNVNDGYKVFLCVKKGSSSSEQGPVDLGKFVGPIEDQKVYYPGTSGETGFSHYAFRFKKVKTPTYSFQFEKVWDGDEIDLEGVEVVFSIGDVEWSPGDPAVEVKPGDELSPLSETVTGLPENCTYESDLPESYVVFSDLVYTRTAVVEPMVDTLTVTNTVECEDDAPEEEEGEVLADVTVPPTAQVVAPAGAVNAGAGSATVAISSVAGLLGSLSAVAYGAVRFFKGE